VSDPGDVGIGITIDLEFLSGFMETVTLILRNFFNFLLRGLRNALAIFKVVWDKFLKRGIMRVIELLGKLRDWLNRTFGPLLSWLHRIRDIIDKWYNRIFGPILNTIQHVRGILAIFRALHFKWAIALDARLLRIEQRIIEPYTILRRYLNLFATYLNLILTPELLLSPWLHLSSIFNVLKEIRRLLGYGTSGVLTADVELKQQQDHDRYTKANTRAYGLTLAKSGITDEDREMQKAAQIALEEAQDAPLGF
jgi:hypothetical protein